MNLTEAPMDYFVTPPQALMTKETANVMRCVDLLENEEEPIDNITRQYNELMKQMLPDYGIELVEIPRKQGEDGIAISATQVRTWMNAGDWEKCKAYLPPATLKYIVSKMKLNK